MPRGGPRESASNLRTRVLRPIFQTEGTERMATGRQRREGRRETSLCCPEEVSAAIKCVAYLVADLPRTETSRPHLKMSWSMMSSTSIPRLNGDRTDLDSEQSDAKCAAL